jgi:uncharacterized protein YceK
MEILMIWLATGFLSGCLTIYVLRKASDDYTHVLGLIMLICMTAQGFFSIIFAIPLFLGFLVNHKRGNK